MRKLEIPKVRVTYTLSQEAVKKLRRLSRTEGRNQNTIIERLIKSYPQKPKART